jgi:hypothetical protein
MRGVVGKIVWRRDEEAGRTWSQTCCFGGRILDLRWRKGHRMVGLGSELRRGSRGGEEGG